MLDQMTFPFMTSATSSQGSEVGRTRSDSQGGPTTEKYGPALAPASPSVLRDSNKGPTTTDIYGPSGSALSASADLTQSLANRLQANLQTSGSFLYRLTWKEKAIGSGRSIYRLVASAHRTSDSGVGSWPTPIKSDASDAARTTTVSQKWKSDHVQASSHTALDIARLIMSHWATPTTRDYKGAGPDGRVRDGVLQMDSVDRQVVGIGQMPTTSLASTINRGQLNPAHTRWLMGYPAEWDDSAPTETLSSLKRRRQS